MDKDIDLDALFAEATLARADPSPSLVTRILADADKLQPKPQALARPMISARPHGGWFAGLAVGLGDVLGDVLGGGRAVAGLSLAGLTGLYLGMAQPGAIGSLTSLVSGTTTTVEQMDLLPATGSSWTEN